MTTAKRITAGLSAAAMLGTMFLVNLGGLLDQVTGGLLGGGLTG